MPRPAVHIGPKTLVEASAPRLQIGPYHTTSSALHSLEFTGNLRPWPGFLSAVQNTHDSYAWRNECLGLSLRTRDPYTYGNVVVGDEHGVQGRFHKYFGDTMNAVFNSQSMGMRFANFKCIQSTYSGIPDVILMDDNHQLKVVGELKVPWIRDHDIAKNYYRRDGLRKILAQPIQYMQALGCVHEFLSNYDQTILGATSAFPVVPLSPTALKAFFGLDESASSCVLDALREIDCNEELPLLLLFLYRQL
ncbi:hypothetical protein PEBR_14693 [Penicillium brasilianum]|uniref:Uncharacterized protein n=1 Tax=Penicillium brasilianum TaxID=104259 RepID=A0A1S9RSQ1_PENBI|nr:hypothetical protein PEBR_14693 [Penicillium brasilianum]